MNLSDWVAQAAEVSPRSLASFLGSHDWNMIDGTDSYQVWDGGSGGDDTQVMIPLDRTYSDFNLRLGETLRVLGDVFKWDWAKLSSNIAAVTSDFMFIRADQHIQDASIPFRQAESLILGAGELLFAAARSTINPRPHYAGRQPIVAKNFMDDDVRMGHTQRGSFIITVLTRLDEAEDKPAYEVGPRSVSPADLNGGTASSANTTKMPPFQRRVMATLANGLDSAYKIATDTGTLTVDDAVARGMSSNMVEALTSMTSYSGLRSLDLSFAWSADKSIPHPAVEQVILDREVIPELPSLGNRLKMKVSTPETETIFGMVTRLELEPGVKDDEVDHESGIVTVRGVSGKAQQRQAKIRLEGAQYDEAFRAHRRRDYVTVSGTLDKQNGLMWLIGDVRFTTGAI